MSTAVTLKQLEALLWIANLGTFERAALKLNTTQSAVSKRIQELEVAVGIEVFDRSLRGARLTERGEYLVGIAEDMLSLHNRIYVIKDGGQASIRKIRIGVTELIAMTWLPRMVSLLRASYPDVVLEPEVDMSRNLYERLLDDSIDLIAIPETFSSPEITSVRLAEVRNDWMAKPGLVPGLEDKNRVLRLSELAEYPILSQGGRSGSGLFFTKWFRNQGIVFPRQLSSDSMTALLGLAIAGLGLSYMPSECFQSLINEGKLVVIPTEPVLPPVPYAAMYRNDRPSAIASAVANLALASCDFSTQFQQ